MINLAKYNKGKKEIRETCVNEALKIIKAEAQSGNQLRNSFSITESAEKHKKNPVTLYADWIEEALEVKNA